MLVRREARVGNYLPICTARADIWQGNTLFCVISKFRDWGCVDVHREAAEKNGEVSGALTSPGCEHPFQVAKAEDCTSPECMSEVHSSVPCYYNIIPEATDV